MPDFDELQYRSAVRPSPIARDNSSKVDEANYDTLKQMSDYLEGVLEALYKDFNAFDVLGTPDPKVAAENLLVDVRANKKAYAAIFPVYTTIKNVVDKVDTKYRSE